MLNYLISQNVKKIISNSNYNLKKLGITNKQKIYYNLSYKDLYKHEIRNKEGIIYNTKHGNVFGIDTGKFTGRSPKDKWIVKNIGEESEKNIWWGNVNQAIEPKIFDDLLNKSINHFNNLDSFYLFDGYCGSNKNSQKKVRFIHEMAWQQHFVTNMFITTNRYSSMHSIQHKPFDDPDFTIINACSIVNDKWQEENLNSETAIAFNIEKKIAIILGTWYGGENKKGIFSLMNYWLPLEGIMSMHCSANVGKKGDTALFFGLSGTGKTTLSADPKRYLIGDDEHGWDDNGIFNFEGGCYAKTINLTEENEPDIYKAIKKNALLENVYINDDNSPDYFNTSKTENGRVSYPIDHISNWYKPQQTSHPNNIIFLTCDAFGVLPPVAKLSNEEAMYYFLSGYTAKVAGTERGISEPQATFSACFGEAFLTLHPTKYADLLKKKIEKHNCNVYLVNTGWSGGEYGVGERISIKDTRYCIDSILDNSINNSIFFKDKIFGFEVPIKLPNISRQVCNPREAWKDKCDYDKKAMILAKMFIDNYSKYINVNYTDYSIYGPKLK